MPRTTQLERIAVIETKVETINIKVDGLHTKLDEFIDCADEKYTHKGEFDDFKKEVREQKKAARSWIQWIPGIMISIILLIITFTR